MARIRGSKQSIEGFSGKIRDIVAEKGTAAAAAKFGRSESTIKSWAKGTSAPNARDNVILKVNRSYSASKPRWEPKQHTAKVEKIYGNESTSRTGSILTYMKVLNTAHPLSRNAKAFFIQQHEEGNVISWKGDAVMPVTDVRIIPAMSDPKAPVTGGALAFGLTASYRTGQKGKNEQVVHGIVTQKINRAVYKTKSGGLHKTPDKLTPDQMHEETKHIHLTSKVNAQRLPAIYLGYGED